MLQSLLLIYAVVSFSVLSLTTNQRILDQLTTIFNTESQITGIGYAQQLMKEISYLSFDEQTTAGQTINSKSDLTLSANFGTDGAEATPDDIDDYHGLTFNYDSQRLQGFQATVWVSYVDTLNPKLAVTDRTYLKRITLSVKNPKFMADSLVLEQLIAHY